MHRYTTLWRRLVAGRAWSGGDGANHSERVVMGVGLGTALAYSVTRNDTPPDTVAPGTVTGVWWTARRLIETTLGDQGNSARRWMHSTTQCDDACCRPDTIDPKESHVDTMPSDKGVPSPSRTDAAAWMGGGTSRLIFMGSGSSTGCPRPLCAMVYGDNASAQAEDAASLEALRQQWAPYCPTSSLAIQGPALDNKDYRNNPSLLISLVTSEHDQRMVRRRNVIIDVGKTFREGALRWFPHYGIRSLDAIVLTHEHMDAAAGLDDVRGFQRYEPARASANASSTADSKVALRQVPMPLFASSHCLMHLSNQFPWLLPPPPPPPVSTSPLSSTQPVVTRHVASFDVTVFEAFQPFEVVPGFAVTPLPVMHGEDLVSFGFAFTVPAIVSDDDDPTKESNGLNVVYLSDISRMLPETLAYIQTQLPQPTHVLVLDALLTNDEIHPVHYNLPQSLALVAQIQPVATYLVGMNCDSFLPHDAMNAQLFAMIPHGGASGTVQLAHDGLVLEVAPTVQDAPVG